MSFTIMINISIQVFALILIILTFRCICLVQLVRFRFCHFRLSIIEMLKYANKINKPK